MSFLPGRLDWGIWVYGLVAAVIGGGSSAITSGFVVSSIDPKDFAFFSLNTLKLMGMVFLVGGVLNGASYLKQNSLPQITTVTKVESVVQHPGSVVTTTVEKTKVEGQN